MSIQPRFAALLTIALATGCAGSAMHSAAMPSAPSAAPAAPQVLDHSVFSTNPDGSLSEEALQTILASPIELDLPSRVGVLPIATATDWRGPAPDYANVPAGVGPLVDRLRHDESFSLVTQMMPIPSGALGMEALREAAARYRLRYIVLYREVIKKDHHVGPWAAGYATVLGAFFLPGQEQEATGYIEASMFDVKTGLLMLTTRRSIDAHQRANEWNTDEKLDQLAARASTKFAPDLATDLLADVRKYAAAAVAENAHRGAQVGLVRTPTTPMP